MGACAPRGGPPAPPHPPGRAPLHPPGRATHPPAPPREGPPHPPGRATPPRPPQGGPPAPPGRATRPPPSLAEGPEAWASVNTAQGRDQPDPGRPPHTAGPESPDRGGGPRGPALQHPSSSLQGHGTQTVNQEASFPVVQLESQFASVPPWGGPDAASRVEFFPSLAHGRVSWCRAWLRLLRTPCFPRSNCWPETGPPRCEQGCRGPSQHEPHQQLAVRDQGPRGRAPPTAQPRAADLGGVTPRAAPGQAGDSHLVPGFAFS